MKTIESVVLVIVLFAVCYFASPILAQEQGSEPEQQEQRTIMDILRERITGTAGTPINIVSSGSMETSGDWVTVREDAEVTYKDISVLADLITFNRSTRELRAEGNVVLIQPGIRVGGDRLQFNLNDRTGWLENPIVETEEGMTVTGERLEKLDEVNYRLQNATLTSCKQSTPNWHMRASVIRFEKGSNAELIHPRFHLFTLPIFYFPYVRFPMNQERSSGILFPVYGHSDHHGNFLNTGYFWAFSRSADATFGLDYYELRGWRYNGEYRHNAGDGNFLEARLSFIEDSSVNRNRYDSLITGRQRLPGGIAVSAKLEFLSDSEYRRDFVNRRVWYSPLYRKYISATKSFGPYTLTGSYNHTHRFRSLNRTNEIRFLPIIDFRAREQQVGDSPIYVSFRGNYARPAIIDRTKGEGEDTVIMEEFDRGIIHATVKAPIKSFAPWLTLTPSFQYRQQEYSRQRLPDGSTVDQRLSLHYYDFEFSSIGPVFSRVFGSPERYGTRYKHIIEPRLTYRWRSDIEDRSRVIIVDGDDIFYKVHELQWALYSRLLRKTTSERDPSGRIEEFITVSLRQYITLDDQLQTSYSAIYMFDPDSVQAGSRFSPLRIDGTIRLSSWLTTQVQMEYSFDTNDIINYTVTAGVNKGDAAFHFGWYNTTFIRFLGTGFRRASANRLVTSGQYSLLDGMLGVRGALDYDFERERLLNFLVGLDVNTQCLGVNFNMRKLSIMGQDDYQYRFGVTIGGVRSLFDQRN